MQIRNVFGGALVAVAMMVSGRASAAVVGPLTIANSSGQGATFFLNNVDFLPAGGGTGTDATGIGTNVTYVGGGPLGAGVAGTIKDLAPLGSSPLDFMIFAGNASLHFDLTSVGPGVANTVPAAALNPNLPANSPSVGSPYILTPTSTGTTLTLAVSGVARDGSSDISAWSGLLTSQFPGVTPAQVTTTLLQEGSVSSTWSGAFSATGIIPEPAAASFLAIAGLAGCVVRRRR